jgi:TRAP-type mannitol/chloroaromatic compound transport system permease small subunit
VSAMHPPERTAPGLPLLDRLCAGIGRAAAWLTLAMVLVTFLVVILRYSFHMGRIWLQESITWMHAFVFLLGAAWTLQRQEHVRVDVLYRRFTPRQRAWVDLLGMLLLLLPTCGYILFESWDYVAASWRVREGSREAGGLQALFLLKTGIPVMAGLLILQGLSEVVRAARILRAPPGGPGGPEAPAIRPPEL